MNEANKKLRIGVLGTQRHLGRAEQRAVGAGRHLRPERAAVPRASGGVSPFRLLHRLSGDAAG